MQSACRYRMAPRRSTSQGNSIGFWLTTWVFFCIGAMCMWQITHLQHRQRLVSPAVDDVAVRELQALVGSWSVPGESTLSAKHQVGQTEADKFSFMLVASAAGATARALGQRLTIPAESPLDHFLQPPPETGGGTTAVVGDDAGTGGDGTGAGECTDVHPNADSPNMLHVVYASDPKQGEGLQASVASVIASTANPDALTVHILVQTQYSKEFKDHFGIRPECQGSVTVTGVLVKVHELDEQLLGRAVAKVPSNVVKARGRIDTVENFARFYMHLFLENTVVVYLDADTIVQADLAILRKQLLNSGRTIGFVKRDGVKMEKFLLKEKNCVSGLTNIKKLMNMPAYNVGVFAVNLQRWKDLQIAERVEDLVQRHNACGGRLWVGGSQPPLLLAFLSRPVGAPEDFIVFDKGWNTGDLGWRADLDERALRTTNVLHWNGKQKPWKKKGLYQSLWLPHQEKFKELLRPFGGWPGGGGPGDGQKEPGLQKGSKTEKVRKDHVVTTSTTLSPEEVAAAAACPSVHLLDAWYEETSKPCKIGSTFGCLDGGDGMWVDRGCFALFSVSGKITVCGGQERTTCLAGVRPKPTTECGLMLVTTFLTTKKDWQRNKKATPTASKLMALFRTVIKHGLHATVVYDSLPQEIIDTFSCENFRFNQVNLNDFNPRYGVNDVRYFFFDRLLRESEVAHDDQWRYMFIVDAFDVRIGMNPCEGLSEGLLYVGRERAELKTHPWMAARFRKMGGKYLHWYKEKLNATEKILNCGITGGSRSMMKSFLEIMLKVLQDPSLSIMDKNEDINLNMAAENYIVYNHFKDTSKSGSPIHSSYKKFQNKRQDVWFIHK